MNNFEIPEFAELIGTGGGCDAWSIDYGETEYYMMITGWEGMGVPCEDDEELYLCGIHSVKSNSCAEVTWKPIEHLLPLSRGHWEAGEDSLFMHTEDYEGMMEFAKTFYEDGLGKHGNKPKDLLPELLEAITWEPFSKEDTTLEIDRETAERIKNLCDQEAE
tara:strand:+ start:229 stop:714 length:486 start_codon:yes stop_codon:yes gene_type:complete